MRRNFCADLKEIKKFINKGDRTQLFLFLYERYRDLIHEVFQKHYDKLDTQQKKYLEKKLGDKLPLLYKPTLSQWIYIFKRSGLFKIYFGQQISPRIWNFLKEMRNLKAHPEKLKLLKKQELDAIYFRFVQSLFAFGYSCDREVHSLCEFCLNEWMEEKRDKNIGIKCMKKINLIELYGNDLQERIEIQILNILKMFFPEIKKAFNKYSKQRLEHPKEFKKRILPENIKKEELSETQKELMKESVDSWLKRKKLLKKDIFAAPINDIFQNLFSTCEEALFGPDGGPNDIYLNHVIEDLIQRYANELADYKKMSKEAKKGRKPKEKEEAKDPLDYVWRIAGISSSVESKLPFETSDWIGFRKVPDKKKSLEEVIKEDLRNLKAEDFVERLVVLSCLDYFLVSIKEPLEQLKKIESEIIENFSEGILGTINKKQLENILNSLGFSRDNIGEFLKFIILHANSA